uniref:Uncharacterized protein n=1 Tax=Arundo donax TaxID=35708 RepID=A0A0A9PHG5_ARUDO
MDQCKWTMHAGDRGTYVVHCYYCAKAREGDQYNVVHRPGQALQSGGTTTAASKLATSY